MLELIDVCSEVSTASSGRTPLVVDLDGTLIGPELLIESGFELAGRNLLSFAGAVLALRGGKAQLKDYLAARTALDPSKLPYNEAVLNCIRTARAAGRPVFLTSTSNERFVAAVANHLGLFNGWFASDQTTDLSKVDKASRLLLEFGKGGFEYIGNGEDIPVWAASAGGIAVGASARLQRKLAATGPNTEYLPVPKPRLMPWLGVLRVHQYVKNVLVFVPLVTAHKFEFPAFLAATIAAMAFSLCASGVYVFNDLVDLNADRAHPVKRHRSLASGAVPVRHGLPAILALLVSAAALAAAVSWLFLCVVMTYLVLSTAYTLVLKRKMLVDVIVLAMLYTLRVIGGAVAINVVVSEWLFAFSLFIFAALALIKRYAELAMRLDADLPDPSNRNYRRADLTMVGTLAAVAGFNAITIFTLYISSDAVHQLYSHPQFLWLICPILMYWVGRILLLAHRRLVIDDPIAFAMRDWNSIVAAICIAGILIAAL
jgi:4-hydroxybenzoate polyprenyltransferase